MSIKDVKAENYHLMFGDCLERMKEIPSGSVKLIVTDQQYRMTKRGKSCRPNWMKDNMGENVFEGKVPDFSEWLSLCYDKMEEDSKMYVFTNTVSFQEILNSATDVGFKLHNILTMIKDTKMPNRWYLKYTELVLFLRKGKAYGINDKTSRDYFFSVMPKKKNGKLHITQKPLEPLEMFIKNSSQDGDTVLDLFMGSGSTGVAALNTNRKFIGIESYDEYFDISVKRISEVIID